MKMQSLAENLNEPTVSSKKQEWFPTVYVSEKMLEGIGDKKLGDKVMLVVEATVTSVNQANNEPKNFTLELKKAGIKTDGK